MAFAENLKFPKKPFQSSDLERKVKHYSIAIHTTNAAVIIIRQVTSSDEKNCKHTDWKICCVQNGKFRQNWIQHKIKILL